MKIHLQGIGEKPAKPAKEIKIGDVLIWNFGEKSIVKSITETKSGKSINILEDYDGKIYKRRLLKNTLVACKGGN